MKVLVVTVAGMSSRFSESVGEEKLKCIYYKRGIEESLLYRLLHYPVKYERYIIVGGYQFDELEKIINLYFGDIRDKIILVKNNHYHDYGSGYSLYLGLEKSAEYEYDELVFAEGDLYFDLESYRRVYKSKKNIITCNGESIIADKAVAFYYDINHKVHYMYDTSHNSFQIGEPFLGIFNSGQVWKFVNRNHLLSVVEHLSIREMTDTNLVIIEKYFETLSEHDYEIIRFNRWINCNTIADFNKIGENLA